MSVYDFKIKIITNLPFKIPCVHVFTLQLSHFSPLLYYCNPLLKMKVIDQTMRTYASRRVA